MVRLTVTAAFLPILLLAAGCARHTYEVRLEPTEAGLDRRIVVSAGGSGAQAAAELARFEALHGKGTPSQTKGNVTFQVGDGPPTSSSRNGVAFQSLEPHGTHKEDIGGSRLSWHASSVLGHGGTYSERIRGREDLGGSMRLRLAAAQDVAHLLRGMAALALPDRPELLERLEIELRGDLEALAIHMMGVELQGVMRSQEDTGFGPFLSFLAQRWIERGLLRPEEAAGITDLKIDNTSRLPERLLTRLLGGSEEAASFFLDAFGGAEGDAQQRQLRLARQFVARPEFRRVAARWMPLAGSAIEAGDRNALEREVLVSALQGSASPEAPLDEDVNPERVIERTLDGLAPYFLGSASSFVEHDALTVSLVLPVAPVATNGEWISEEGIVRWKGTIPPRGHPSAPPTILTASWAVPDVQAQTRRFGRVILEGKELLEVLSWEATSPPAVRESFRAWSRERGDAEDEDDAFASLVSRLEALGVDRDDLPQAFR